MDLDENDLNLTLIKDKLNTLKIKLWLSPFYNDGIESTSELQALALKFKDVKGITEEETFNYLKALQKKSIENLNERELYQSTGLATLKVRPSTHGIAPFPIKIALSSDGKLLRNLIAEKLSGQKNKRIKMIWKGKILTDDILEHQGVKHGTQIMVLLLASKESDVDEFITNNQMLDSTVNDVNVLTGKKNDDGESYLQIADQSGKPLKLPAKEQKALVLAMTLHEKGRCAMKKENFDLALLLLLEAEKSFSQCNSGLLEQVDNYGLLSLDLAWSYLNLQSLSQLTDAQNRLNRCQQIFKKSYGEKLERLLALKGSTGNEAALFVRFHLLQAIIFYHQGKVEQAKELFDRVDSEIKNLKVDDSKLSQLIELGYQAGESRLALRESKNNADQAVAIIENKKAERERNKELEKLERALNVKRRKLGKCLNGNWIEPQFYESLMAMGYSSNTARWALRETGNRIADAVTLIQDHPERIPSNIASDEVVSQMISLGFDQAMASDTLLKYNGNLEEAVKELTSQKSEASTSRSDDKAMEKVLEEEAYSRVAEGITDESEDYLDLTLSAEETFLRQYQLLLSKQ